MLERASKVMPGGVSSPVRAFRTVGGTPVFVASAEGPWLIAQDGRRYIDYICGYGPHILGHRHPAVVQAVVDAAQRGTTFGTPTREEIELAELIRSEMPHLEMVRLVNSGTEAAMSALRLARAATGRDKFIKFAGHYHGHADSFLVAAGSGAQTLGVPTSPGVPADLASHTLVAPFNDLEAVAQLFADHGGEIACIAVEPIAGNMGMVLPQPGFLAGLRQLCDDHGALLLFDEVMTGFRVARGGAQSLFGVVPDLTALGKVIGGGLPIAAYGGKAHLMAQIAPSGPVYQAGTLSGNPIAVAAGLAALRELIRDGGAAFQRLEELGQRLENGLRQVVQQRQVSCQIQRRGGMLGFVLSSDPILRLEDVDASDRDLFNRLFHHLLRSGVHLPPSPYEAFFFSIAHEEEIIDRTVEAFGAAFRAAAEDDPESPSTTP
ncbi:MAG: glutamate-1-semialdehyde 2,1-aminomutase [Acidobacteriota bacterium]